MAENSSHRKLCVVWTTVAESEDACGRTEETYTDHSQYFEEGAEEEKRANDFYAEVLQKEDTHNASLCKILRDSEG